MSEEFPTTELSKFSKKLLVKTPLQGVLKVNACAQSDPMAGQEYFTNIV